MKGSHEFLDQSSTGSHDTGFGRGRKQTDSMNSEICEVYDLLISKGMEQNLAIRRTRAILKATEYPFVTYDGIMTRLRAAGRFRKRSQEKM
jgi:hypothetical protein